MKLEDRMLKEKLGLKLTINRKMTTETVNLMQNLRFVDTCVDSEREL